MATPEKAVLDLIYLRKTVLFGDELELDLLNQKKLNDLAGVYPERVLKAIRKRLEIKIFGDSRERNDIPDIGVAGGHH
ncbi:MAG: hypothetical protein AB1659_07020 [Thermodesulfobacteriota bacterium]